MASDIWLRTILIVRKETRCRHIGYSFRLTARVLLYAPSHRQDSTYHGLCYTSRGGSIRRPIMSERSYHGATCRSRSYINSSSLFHWGFLYTRARTQHDIRYCFIFLPYQVFILSSTRKVLSRYPVYNLSLRTLNCCGHVGPTCITLISNGTPAMSPTLLTWWSVL